MKKIRIPLCEDNSSLFVASSSDNPGSNPNDNTNDNPGGSADPDYSLLPIPDISFQLIPVMLEGYMSGRYEYPVTSVGFSFPEADLQRVKSWFESGVSTAGLPAASDTLLKHMTQSVTSAITSYYSYAARRGLFTRPCRIGWSFRLKNGAHVRVSDIMRLLPALRAPMLRVVEHTIASNTLDTVTEIINTPCRLTVNIAAFNIPEELSGLVTHIDIYATKQFSMLTGSETVAGIYTDTQYGTLARYWSYPRESENYTLSNIDADSNFRLLASLPIEEASCGIDALSLPYATTTLEPWNDLEKYEPETEGKNDNDDSGKNDDQNNEWQSSRKLITSALDLGLPETEKRLRSVTLRGIFSRNPEDVTMRLYGSHHRADWRHIATCRGAHLRILRGVRYRWFRVEADIDLNPDDKLDALTFEIS